ncbi:MAG TPA: IclR family transcriptional regulator [Aromatoleum sp.]|uniref:IclR family transcriptional regulator n=1 Tax=Aromatoleum sp. TaxID=2307007 RepID=UPI002B472519|nr:IclR family transcriptional regulator [Aromatoleum sp.]HJV25628.1 IclR family transcriptional regulator [Aromatoleum sp.]
MSDTMPNTLEHVRQKVLFNQSLEKGLAVLLAFCRKRRTMTIAEVAEATGINKSSAQRMVFTLEQLGYLRKHPQTRRYQLTPRVMEVGFNYLATNPVIELANPFLSELTNLTKETCCLAEPDGNEMVYVARFASSQFVPVHMPIGTRIPIYCSGSGRAYLSALSDADALRIIERCNRVQHTPHTRTDIEDILEELSIARERGYAVNQEELFLGDMVLAAPVVGADGRPLGALNVVAPTGRWSREEAEYRLGPSLVQCARAVSSSICATG